MINSNVDNGITENGAPYYNREMAPVKVEYQIEKAHAPHNIYLTLHFLDGCGNHVNKPVMVDFWISDSSGQHVFEEYTPDDLDIRNNEGSVYYEYKPKAQMRIVSSHNGIVSFRVNDRYLRNYYFACTCPFTGFVNVSREIVKSDYR